MAADAATAVRRAIPVAVVNELGSKCCTVKLWVCKHTR